jgi:glycosyltransferase involved in cell wall biosynthesis
MNNPAGGSAESTLTLIEDLADAGIESSVVCHATGSAEAMAAVDAAVQGRLLVTRLWWWNRRTRAMWWRRPLADLRESVRTGRGRRSAASIEPWARAQGIDLVHTNTILVPEGARVAGALGVPHVWHLRELIGPGHPYRFWNEPRFLSHRVATGCQVLVANSEASLATVAPWLPDDLARVVPNGIDTAGFARIADPSNHDPLVVGMVGNLTSRMKEHDLFVRAAARVRRDLAVRFVLVGHDPVLDGRDDAYAAALHDTVARTGLSDRFEFVGFVDDPARAMAMVDVLVHPCAHESFGRVAIEAMAAGRPVVGVDGGGIGEVVDHEQTGLLVPPGDEVGLARAIERLAVEPETRRRLGDAGRAVARHRYDRAIHAEGIRAAYEDASRRHRDG